VDPSEGRGLAALAPIPTTGRHAPDFLPRSGRWAVPIGGLSTMTLPASSGWVHRRSRHTMVRTTRSHRVAVRTAWRFAPRGGSHRLVTRGLQSAELALCTSFAIPISACPSVDRGPQGGLQPDVDTYEPSHDYEGQRASDAGRRQRHVTALRCNTADSLPSTSLRVRLSCPGSGLPRGRIGREGGHRAGA